MRKLAFMLPEAVTRKGRTFFSLLHSSVVVQRDGINPFSMDHTERLRYIQLQPALSWKKGVVIYDIGANVGEFTRFAACLPTVRLVYCFEPVAAVFQELVKNTSNFTKVECFNTALGDRNSMPEMYVNHFSPSSSLLPICPVHVKEFPGTNRLYQQKVQLMTLREAMREYKLSFPDFIKMDAQGFEDRIISGGIEVIKRARYCMLELSLVELYEGAALITEINALMRSIDFHLIEIIHKVTGRSGEILQIDGLYRNDRVCE